MKHPPLKLIWKEDIANENRGWVEHKLEAYISANSVGYIKVTYIPKEEFKARYKTIWDYKRKIEGWSCHGIYEPRLVMMHNHMRAYSDWGHKGINADEIPKVGEPISDHFLTMIKEAEVYLNDSYGRAFKKFRAYHVDRPYVAYSDVDVDFRRQGIGTALYFGAAEKLREKGLTLSSSDTQSDLVRAFWKGIANRHPDKVKRKRKKNVRRTFWEIA